MIKKVLITFMLLAICLSLSFNFTYAASNTDPTLIKKLNSALNKIKDWLVKLALPAAAVGIASGVMIRKFSFGNEEKLILGKKVIINAIIGYAIILGIDMILKTIEALV